MRFFYRCTRCKCGFWYDKEIHDNNVECLHCGADGNEETFDDELKKVVPTVYRIMVAPNGKGEIELPSYSYECRKCGTKFGVYRDMKTRNNVKCKKPTCDGTRADLDRIYDVPHVISDIDHQEGRTNEDLDMSHVFGEGARISSRKQLGMYKRVTRDRYFQNTDKNNTVMRPFKDQETGQIHWDYVTKKGEGIDLGEIHEVDGSTVKSAADVGKEAEKEWREAEHKAAAQIEVAD